MRILIVAEKLPLNLFFFDLLDAQSFTYPVIVKRSLGRLGVGVDKINDATSLEKNLISGSGEFLVQKFLTTGEDFRIFVISAEKKTKELSQLAEKSAKLFKIDYAD